MNPFIKPATTVCMSLLGGFSLADSLAVQEPTISVWQKHEYQFTFLGFTTTYSCDGLADKLKLLLLAAGAREDTKASPAACARGFGSPDKFASAYLTFYSLSAPDADPIAASRQITGSWRTVKFMPRSPLQLGLGDCELIEQFRERLLPIFTVRDIDAKITCIPHQLSGSAYSLAFQSLALATVR